MPAQSENYQPHQTMFMHFSRKLAEKMPRRLGRELDADDFDMLAGHLQDVADVMDAYVNRLMQIAQEHSTKIPANAFTSEFADTVHDNIRPYLSRAAQEWRDKPETVEDTRADQWRGLHRTAAER